MRFHTLTFQLERASREALQSDDAEDVFHMCGEVSETLRDVAELEKPYEADDEIPDARHEVSALARLMTVLVEGNVPYPVQSVLDLPMAPVEGEDALGIVFQARDPVSCFRAAFPALREESGTFYPEDGLSVREVDISLKFVARPYLSRLYPSMPFVGVCMIRGETPPYGGLRCLAGGFRDCL